MKIPRRLPAGAASACAALTVAFAGAARAQEPADLIVTGGVVHTMDPDRPRVEAIAVTDGVVVGLGTAADVTARFEGERTEVLSLEGRTVIPGLIDAHGHVLGLGGSLRTLDLVGTGDPRQIAALVREAAQTRSPDAWILGRGWDQNDWPDKVFPTHARLDSAAPDNPVFLTRVDGHAGWANAAAMERAGVTASTPDPPGGRIERDADGRPTGVFVDAAQALIESRIPAPDDAELAARLSAAQERLLSVGLTGVHDMGIDRRQVELYRAWEADGRLLLRVVAYLDSDSLETLEWWAGEDRVDPSARFRVVGVKLYADGALGSRGAALLTPYSDDPGNEGLLVTAPDSLASLVSWTLEHDLQPAIHAIGDRGNRAALDAIAGAIAEIAGAPPGGASVPADRGERPPRIEHAQVLAPSDIPRFAELGVVASVQPTHATSDMYWAEDRLGPVRIEGAYAWRRLLDAGADLACGSDFPVEDPNPLHGLYAAVTRRDAEGWPEGGWRSEERLSAEEALACFTTWPSRVADTDAEVGSLSIGRRADFLVLDGDVLAVPPDEIRRTRVLRTFVDGRSVYRSGVTPAGP